jgi:hypothetical protein
VLTFKLYLMSFDGKWNRGLQICHAMRAFPDAVLFTANDIVAVSTFC